MVFLLVAARLAVRLGSAMAVVGAAWALIAAVAGVHDSDEVSG